MYDSKRDSNPLIPARYGVTAYEGVPFELLDPTRTDSGNNVLVLKGGLVPDWESKVGKPQRVELKVNATVQRVHVLGGIAGWGYPYIKDSKPIVKWTWRFADGTSEEHVLKNGVEFADWIGHIDVPGSEHVDGALGPGSWGQVRRFAVELATPRAVDRIVLESYDNELAPTFLALTAELPGAPQRDAKQASAVDALIFGGGSSHDFARWFDTFDVELLRAGGFESVRYTASLNETLRSLELAKALVLCTNQSVDGPEFRAALAGHVERGGGLLLLHPATWFNWPDWAEYNARIVGGGSRSHEALGEFEVRIVDASHPLTQGVPATFRIVDELYRFERAATDAPIEVLAVGKSLTSGDEFPVLWTVKRADGRTVGYTLGHDGRAHEHPAFGRIYQNALSWILER
jgi:type 1 glutamine amidotransferase